jgi:hypothetical protein
MTALLVALLAPFRSSVRFRLELEAEICALRHQLAVLQRQAPSRPRLDRVVWPDTVVRWHWQLRETSPEIVALIDQLLETHTDAAIATTLNARGYLSGTGERFQGRIVQHIRRDHHHRPRYDRLRARGLLTRNEIANRLYVSADTVKIWARVCSKPGGRCITFSTCSVMRHFSRPAPTSTRPSSACTSRCGVSRNPGILAGPLQAAPSADTGLLASRLPPTTGTP